MQAQPPPLDSNLTKQPSPHIINIKGAADKRLALQVYRCSKKKPSPCRVAVSAFHDDRHRIGSDVKCDPHGFTPFRGLWPTAYRYGSTQWYFTSYAAFCQILLIISRLAPKPAGKIF